MTSPFLGELRIMSFPFAPKGWAMANGQLLPINQNQALFSLFGTTYGGDGRANFALPDLRGRVPTSFDNANFTLGQRAGEYSHTLTMDEMANHFHFMVAKGGASDKAIPDPSVSLAKGHSTAQGQPPVTIFGTGAVNRSFAADTITNTGGGQPHNNTQPYLCLNVCVALQGIFPSRN